MPLRSLTETADEFMESESEGCFHLYVASVLLLVLASEPFAVAAAAITRDDFPPGFIFGAGTSAYQAEGAVAEDGRKPSIWDTFAHAGLNADQTAADIAADQYHKYKGDVKLMRDMGLDAYRFSMSWSRIIPDGRGPINPKGLQYYNNLINELVSNGIEPHVTLCHFDLPQALQDEYEGLLSPRIVEDFTAYADICFKEFGDRVKNWITFNEPNFEPVLGYDVGIFPPARCSYPFGFNCSEGDSTREPYQSAHNFLLSHASAATLYKEKYQVFTMKGKSPFSNTPWALQEMLEYVKVKYRNPPIIIHENGYGEFDIGPTTGNGTADSDRVTYLQGYIESLLQSVRNGSNTVGYFVWSFIDCFELMFGYTARYGLYGVDFRGADRSRFPRLSAHWYSSFLSNRGLRIQASDIVYTE
ncbi:uncharacterized protein A4U43_C10F4040 [Asparagus officinalis]|uniref:Beta-glucosidase n=1 Tax=Asparagus officinalis TaxID=4686 RepID=A0A5P1E0I1_ASPOF|nr:uncharacterized protein A4U43_C10F4040 [Asparagus officinalis]